LGLTLGCARCHDHKFDAIPTRDYYRLQSAFMTTSRANVLLAPREKAANHGNRRQRERLDRAGALAGLIAAADELKFDPTSQRTMQLRRALMIKLIQMSVLDQERRGIGHHSEGFLGIDEILATRSLAAAVPQIYPVPTRQSR